MLRPFALFVMLSLSACVAARADRGDADGTEPNANAPDATDPDGDGAPGSTPLGPPTNFAIRFRGMVGSEPFVCGRFYPRVGRTGVPAAAADLRFFVHNVRLLPRGGAREVALKLEDDGNWQSDRLALVDLEDKSGACRGGTPQTNDSVRGTAPSASYDGIAFDIGVPEELNHDNVDLATPPLAGSRLQWNWTAGFVHFSAQLDPATGAPFYVHLGSAECSGDPTLDEQPSCRRSNRPTVRLTGFDPTRDVITVDLAALVADSDISTNAPSTISGCMSSPNDADCAPVLARLGVDASSGAATTGQALFRVSR